MSASATPERLRLAAALKEEEARLQRLDAERGDTKARADALRAQIVSLDAEVIGRPQTLPTIPAAPRSPGEKVTLFRQLFRGREDLYPTRFVSKKTGNPGYAPACSNKWEPGLCHLKSGGKCDCPTQFFVPVEDRVVIDHLRGRHDERGLPTLEPSIFLQSNAVRTSGSQAGGFVGASECKR